MVNRSKVLEIGMEEQIEEHLMKFNGFRSRKQENFNKDLCLDSVLVLEFIKNTQIDEWNKLKNQYGTQLKEKLLQRLSDEIGNRGVLDVLRKGIKDRGAKFKLFYHLPATRMNEPYKKLYEGNIFSVTRQVHYSDRTPHKSVDIVLFINGIPIISIEIKDRLSGSGYKVDDAIEQYQKDRDPNELLFSFNRCLVHFAIDECLVFMTTKLERENTKFLPFNKGRNNGAGNPDSDGYRTEYLWKEIFTKKILSDIINEYLHLEDIVDDEENLTGEQRLIFPRYHQLDAVTKLVDDAKIVGPGKNYLIWHSAGSGKTNTIVWLAFKLFSLHDNNDNKVFDSIIVITDRVILDTALQRKFNTYEQTSGVVKNIEEGSKQLLKGMESGKKIFVTTIQKFPYIADEIQEIPSSTFAVIVDEAHSSQSGETSQKLKKTLMKANLGDIEDPTWEDVMYHEMDARGRLENVSFFAFTATPKNKTFQLFGTEHHDGSFKAFHLYSMKQAIEEKFILDVLKNYTTYKTYFRLLKTIETDPRYDKKKVTALLRTFVNRHELNIQKKIEIIVEHFNDYVAHQIPDKKGIGQAKAMIVAPSQVNAVLYKLAIDKYLKEKRYPYKVLVAFSGEITDPNDGTKYTERKMNGFPESQTSDEFKKAKNKFLIAVEKFQTGFDQPLLYAMYLDKKVSNINAVQTLSRLNRVYPNKEEPIVLDFANDVEEIENAFKDYYDDNILSEGTDPNKTYDLKSKMDSYFVYTDSDIQEFSELYFDPKVQQDKLHPILDKVVEIFRQLPEEDQEEFKGLLKDFMRLYSFISQVVTFKDPDLEMFYTFGRYLYRKLPSKTENIPKEVLQQVDLSDLRIQKIYEGDIKLGEADPIKPSKYDGKTHLPIVEKKPLSEIIGDLNEKYGAEFDECDAIILERLENLIASNEILIKSIKVNSEEKVKLNFKSIFEEEIQSLINDNFELYRKINDNQKMKNELMDMMFESIYEKLAKT